MKISYFSIIIMSVFVISVTFLTGAFAQNDSASKYDPTLQYGSKPQTPIETPEQLHKKLVNARDAISNIMGSKMGDIPFNAVSVDEVNYTLDVGIDSSKATLSEEQYLKKIREIVGDIPIKITFEQISSLPLILTNNLPGSNTSASNGVMKSTGPVVITLESPLKAFKSGTAAKDVTCNDDLQLIFKTEDNFPACVKIPTAFHLSELGWGYLPSPFMIKADLLNSTISGGKIKELQYDIQSRSIIIKIQTVSDGYLVVTIPKFMTDLNPSDKPFKDFHTVLADGMEENVDLVPTANGSRFTIPFVNGTQEIEIMGNQVGMQG